MIVETIKHVCTGCGSEDIVKNGKNRYGKQQFKCKACGKQAVLQPNVKYSETRKAEILAAYQERPSMRGISRIYGVSRQTLATWLKKKACECDLKESLVAAQPDDVLELDEVWSFVMKKTRKRWLWTAMCRRTRQIVAFVIGDRSAKTCTKLWKRIAERYKRCHSFSDLWEAYRKVFSKDTHTSVPKQVGETCHMERFNNTLRQRLARYVRRTLSFSKSDYMHHVVTKCFIITYNRQCVS
ncbi:MAG: IS1 family transposase [Deinococcota bacterium]